MAHTVGDRVIIVTGAGSGIGRATALILAKAGASVCVQDVADTANETVSLIEAEGGTNFAQIGDISNEEDAARMVAEAASRGPLNVASEAGIRGAAAGAAYTASKHAVVGLTRNTAYVYGRKGVRCNAVCPGGVETNVMASIDPSKINGEGLGTITPVNQTALSTAKPEQQATLIAYLLSDEASNVNGAIIPNDGGWFGG